ncbi:helix-turn-helix domain-containing protein [Tenacibaculum aiptasiae]|uniref:helix-turn-helix domain-containing protein n=1 Tax=Tenacibaculum aiptasiae TaxID=426481 RepID=UPI00232CEC7E|nr:AraC family transcriptional regulator [Tenacibaculum aiptasiae]
MAKKIIFAIVLFSFIYLFTYRIYHSWLNKKFEPKDVYILKWMYKVVVVFAFFSFLWAPYSISSSVVFIFKLSSIASIFFIATRLGAKTFFKRETVPLKNSEDSIKKEKPSEEIYKKASWLKEQMVANQFYLNPDLTLKSLAENLNMTPHVLSKVINDGLDKNFSDFVNEYRVEAVIEKMHNEKYNHITLLGLSFECGFNSKTTFNRVFKNIKGVTPLAYKKSIKNNSEQLKMSTIL